MTTRNYRNIIDKLAFSNYVESVKHSNSMHYPLTVHYKNLLVSAIKLKMSEDIRFKDETLSIIHLYVHKILPDFCYASFIETIPGGLAYFSDDLEKVIKELLVLVNQDVKKRKRYYMGYKDINEIYSSITKE